MRASLLVPVALLIGCGAAACRAGPARHAAPATAATGESSSRVGVAGRPAGATAEDRRVAFGLLLDSPRPLEVIDEGIAIADRLRLRYGLDSGDRLGDRMEAAGRARAELIDRLSFSEEEIEARAETLGYSLEPAACGEFCDNVRRLAELELQKEALRAFAAGEDCPGRLAEIPGGQRPER